MIQERIQDEQKKHPIEYICTSLGVFKFQLVSIVVEISLNQYNRSSLVAGA